jgi:anti-sigma regulatory factor (Ser/Thr protein kinase)
LSTEVSLKIKAAPDALGRLNEAIESLSSQEDWPPDLLFTANLVIEELSLNVVNHAYHGEDGEFEIVIKSEDHALTIEIIDSGPPFNMLTDAPTPDVEAPIEDRPIGGLGIHLVKTMMDELEYRRERERNHLTMVKRRDP